MLFGKLYFSEDFYVKVTQILPTEVIAHFNWREVRGKGRMCFTCDEMTQTCLLQKKEGYTFFFFFNSEIE